MTTPVKDIISTLRYSYAKCWHMPKPATLTMHPAGFKALRDYLISTQASVQEKQALEPAVPTVWKIAHGLRYEDCPGSGTARRHARGS